MSSSDEYDLTSAVCKKSNNSKLVKNKRTTERRCSDDFLLDPDCFVPESHRNFVPHHASTSLDYPENSHRLKKSPNFLGSKKRLNGDKCEVTGAKSKRTCFSNRLLADRKGILKNGLVNYSSGLAGGSKRAPYPMESMPISPNQGGSNCDPKQGRPHGMHCKKYKAVRSDHVSSEANGAGSSIDQTVENSGRPDLMLPSTSKGKQQSNCKKTTAIKSTTANITILNSDSDSEESKYLNSPFVKRNGCLRRLQPLAKKLGGKLNRRILDSSDSSSSSDCPLQCPKPRKCFISDSDTSDDLAPLRRRKFTKHTISQLTSSDSNEDSNSALPGCSRAIASAPTNATGSSADRSKDHSYSELNGNAKSRSRPPVSARSGSPFIMSVRSHLLPVLNSRGSMSPHPRMLSHLRQRGITTRSASAFNSRLVTDLRRPTAPFWAENDEDSSEVEFFTAYSDNETSSESLGAANVNSSPIPSGSRRNNATVLVDESSDEEISVIFSIDNTQNSEHPPNRRGQGRGPTSMRRRSSRGPGRSMPHSTIQDAVSSSPDPVAQVRQVEEDERFARMLQAEFDAELNEEAASLSSTESDESAIIDPVGLEPVPPVVESVPRPERVPSPQQRVDRFFLYPSIREPRMGLHSNNTMPSGRRRRTRRAIQGDPWMWQFARVLGLSPSLQLQPYDGVDDPNYEALLRISDTMGEVVPRGLCKAQINRLPTRKYVKPGSGSSRHGGPSQPLVHKRADLNKECQVCLNDYENGDILRILPCFHEFHTPCIDPWLKINHTCPVCRVEISFDT